MSKITVLGGCGMIGSMAIRALVLTDDFSRIAIGDRNVHGAQELAKQLGDPRIEVVAVDAEDHSNVRKAISGSQVVLNCIGPFYRYGPSILHAAIEEGIDYVDVCDDLDATERMLEMDGAARQAGISALIGMGNSPGLANLLARYCAEEMLDQVESVYIYHAHGGEADEGPAVVKHRIHAMVSEVPVYRGGEMVKVKMLEESGQALVQEINFRDIGTYPVFPYPHPETITIPKYLHGVKNVANLGVALPLSYFRLIMELVKLGLCSEEPLAVEGMEVIPRDFAVAFVLAQRPRLMAEAGISGPLGCLRVQVQGRKNGETHTYIFSMSSRRGGAGEGTGIPAALGAILTYRGKVEKKGVVPPEGGVNPVELIGLASEVIGHFDVAGEGGGLPLHIEHLDERGNSEEIDFKL